MNTILNHAVSKVNNVLSMSNNCCCIACCIKQGGADLLC